MQLLDVLNVGVVAGGAAVMSKDFVVVFVPVWSESRDPAEVHT